MHACNDEHQFEISCLKHEHAKQLREARATVWREAEAARKKESEQLQNAMRQQQIDLSIANEKLIEDLRIARTEATTMRDDIARLRSDFDGQERHLREEGERHVQAVKEEAERQATTHRLSLADLNSLLEAERKQAQRNIENERRDLIEAQRRHSNEVAEIEGKWQKKLSDLREKISEDALATCRAQQEERGQAETRRRECEEKMHMAERCQKELEAKCVALELGKETLSERLAMGKLEKEAMVEEHGKLVDGLRERLRLAEANAADYEAKLLAEEAKAADLEAGLKDSARLQQEHGDLLAKICAVQTRAEQASAELIQVTG